MHTYTYVYILAAADRAPLPALALEREPALRYAC